MPVATNKYRQEALEDAKDAVRDLAEDIVVKLLAGDDFDDLEDLQEGYTHDLDHSANGPAEQMAVVEELHEFEETDSGLWEGEDLRGIIDKCSSFTYQNAVKSLYRDLTEEIKGDASVQDLLSKPRRLRKLKDVLKTRVLEIVGRDQ